MTDHVSLNEMRERVARLIYADDWIGGLTDAEYELLREYVAPRTELRCDGAIVYLVEPCPVAKRDRLDRAIGRQSRMEAQSFTVEEWLQDRGVPITRPAYRASFDALMQEAEKAKAAAIRAADARRRPGPKPEVVPRLIAAMQDDIGRGRISVDDLRGWPDKELEARYQGGRDSVRKARDIVLANA
jgi:hypothetical protein